MGKRRSRNGVRKEGEGEREGKQFGIKKGN